jgi:hypothetical protein
VPVPVKFTPTALIVPLCTGVGQYTDPLVVVVVAGSVSVVVAMAVAGMTAMMAKARRRISLCIASSLSRVVVYRLMLLAY